MDDITQRYLKLLTTGDFRYQAVAFDLSIEFNQALLHPLILQIQRGALLRHTGLSDRSELIVEL